MGHQWVTQRAWLWASMKEPQWVPQRAWLWASMKEPQSVGKYAQHGHQSSQQYTHSPQHSHKPSLDQCLPSSIPSCTLLDSCKPYLWNRAHSASSPVPPGWAPAVPQIAALHTESAQTQRHPSDKPGPPWPCRSLLVLYRSHASHQHTSGRLVSG